MTGNPYPKRPGFPQRVARAIHAIAQFGRGKTYSAAGMDSRGFDSCFENCDGDAVVWQIMHNACTNPDLERGIRRMGANVWPQWEAIYKAKTEADLFARAP